MGEGEEKGEEGRRGGKNGEEWGLNSLPGNAVWDQERVSVHVCVHVCDHTREEKKKKERNKEISQFRMIGTVAILSVP